MTRENRRSRRKKITAEVFYKNEKNQSFGGCVAKDVGEGGVCIKIGEFFPIGTILNLGFKLPLSPDPFYVKGVVKWINKTPFNEQWEIGLEMKEDEHYQKLIQQYS